MIYISSTAIAALVLLGGVLSEPTFIRQLDRSVFANTNSQVQKTTVFLESEDLKEPYLLQISASSSLTDLSGSISCNGQIIQRLSHQKTTINLSPYLQLGQNNVSIVGQYSPSRISMDVELIGPGTQVSQSMSGSGTLNQSLLIDVE